MLKPVVRTDLVVSPRPNGEGVLVYDPTTDTGHVLEGIAAAVFEACDGTADIAAIEARVAATTGAPDFAAIDRAIDQLSEAGLLDESRGISRRGLLGGLLAGAAAVAIAPVITSVAHPRKASAQPAPSIDPKTATTTADTPVQIQFSGVGIYTPSTVWWVVDQPTHGTVTVTNTSSGGVNTGAYATYTPNPGYSGPDSFRYVGGRCEGIGALYPAPTEAQDACPAGLFISGTSIPPGLVSITVTPNPTTSTTTTTSPADESTPKYTG